MGEQQYQQNMNYQQNGNYQQAGYGQAAYQQQNNGGQQYSQGGVCPACGTQLINGVCPRCTNAQMMAAQNRNDARFTRLFMSPNEKLVATLGNNYIQNYLHNGSVRNGFAVVSDKRAYFYGTSYTISYNGRGNPNANKMSRSQVVDLKDVTGSGFIRMVNIGYAILAWALVIISIFLIMLLYDIEEGLAVIGGLAALSALLFLIYQYYDNKLSLISIQYAGGEIAFDIRWFSGQEINNFHQQLRLAKDKAVENYEYDMAKKISAAINGGKHNNLKRTVQ
ncbi:zinc ribbon domain-containing protein [Coprococcus sp. OM04-5BH]|uniref:zinc ribbon domain-containing protein n=1 Tax=Coprococcus sp. OM04-5BH TaxID=2293093 RepID=UPI000E4E03E1|nr:zinc ribbon domain-containing protein [Coprococcus sp. OM04-5BH]RHV34480.1 zinc ribbon domain-containing protein [Coprococcus sp. OM04-5BH]